MNNRIRIIVLWAIYVWGMIIHDLLLRQHPFFGGIIPPMEGVTPNGMVPAWWLWLLEFTFMMPMIIILLTLYSKQKWHKILNFSFSIIFLIANINHLILHLRLETISIIDVLLLSFILISSIFLCFSSFKWLKEKNLSLEIGA